LHQCIRPLDSNACGAFDAAEQVVAEQRLGITFRCMAWPATAAGSFMTLRWRKADSNPRSPVRELRRRF
jgi:hypothetical protein